MIFQREKNGGTAHVPIRLENFAGRSKLITGEGLLESVYHLPAAGVSDDLGDRLRAYALK